MRKAFFTLTVLLAMMAASLGAKAQEITITLLPGCTWIGYTNAEAMSITAALGDFVPMEGDVIKSQYASTTYSHGRWMGRLQQFSPGLGYMYISMRGEPVSLVFANSTPQSQVMVTTSEPMLITAISAMSGGEVISNDGTYILVKGLCWAAHENPTTNDFYQEMESGEGSFTVSMSDLNIGTTYYVRAYAVTPNGTVYGDQKTFTTRDGIPTVTTAEVTNITGPTASCGGTVTDNGGLNVTARGVCWSTSPTPTVADAHTTDGDGIGAFSSSITGLEQGTTFYVRAYAATIAGTGYGEQKVFTTIESQEGLWVDLGLPSGTLWAICNVGAYSPEESGDYFAWGETQPKDTYNWSTYQYCNGTSIGTWGNEFPLLTKYCYNPNYGYNGYFDNLITLLPEDDAATTNWGTDWRTPTKKEFEELLYNTTSTLTTQNGVNGMLFTASNGNSLFLPAVGDMDDDGGEWYDKKKRDYFGGYYWLSSLDMELEYGPGNANMFLFCFEGDDDYGGYCDYDLLVSSRYIGQPIRPVRSMSQSNAPIGALDGLFSVSATQTVYFSQGNLQSNLQMYLPEESIWRFAENQWDFEENQWWDFEDLLGIWIDLFGWGTGNNPTNSSTNNGNYSSFSDWGNNPIINGGNTASQWRTLTQQEWDYVFNTRTTSSGIRYAKAKVNDVNGVILLPDDWSSSTYSLNNTNSSNSNYSSNVISAAQWYALENEGAVFLPAAGGRNGTNPYNVGTLGYYWSSTYDSNNNNNAYFVLFNNVSLITDCSDYRCRGRSVRLVCDFE